MGWVGYTFTFKHGVLGILGERSWMVSWIGGWTRLLSRGVLFGRFPWYAKAILRNTRQGIDAYTQGF
jgi:hypothetical protein